MGRIGHIYTLRCPETGEVRYVGKTVCPVRVRLNGHLSSARTGRNRNHSGNWMRSLLGKGLVPVVGLELTLPVEELAQAEIDMIAQYRESGARLTNLTDGGEGVSGWTMPEETKRKISKTKKGYKPTPEARAKQSAALKGRRKTAEHRRKIGEGNKGKDVSEETRQKISEARRGTTASPETREKMRAARKGSDNARAKLTELDARAILELHRLGITQKALASSFGVGATTLNLLVTRRTWKHVKVWGGEK